MTRIPTDADLSAHVDDELDAETGRRVAAAIGRDHGLTARVARFRRQDDLLRERFGAPPRVGTSRSAGADRRDLAPIEATGMDERRAIRRGRATVVAATSLLAAAVATLAVATLLGRVGGHVEEASIARPEISLPDAR